MKKAVTLLELLITIIILGILISFAIPNYYKAREHALGRGAMANLELAKAAQEIYRLEFGTYFPMSGVTTENLDDINRYLKLSISGDNWNYTMTGNTDEFTATAKRQGDGGFLNCEYIIQQNTTDGMPVGNADCPAKPRP